MKKSNYYIEVRITGTAPLAELLGAELFDLSAEGIEERADGETGEIDVTKDYGIDEWNTEPPILPSTKRLLLCTFEDVVWDETLPKLDQLVHSFRNLIPDLSFTWERLPYINCVARWKSDLKPVVLSERIGVAPTKNHIPKDHRIWLVIPPKMAFGTGEHPTTRMAANLVSQWVQKGDRVLDAGCGTGILALVALALGAEHATGVDIDADAIREAKWNAKRNHLNHRSKWICGSIHDLEFSKNSFDLIVANIHLTPLKLWWKHIPNLLTPKGRLIATGLLIGQGNRLGKSLGKAMVRKTMGPWLLLGYRIEKGT
ncbi:MAG: 50S ribosomal protein L11 methyltransferase [bacterium]|nr:50S ribosomal protein L11 methyltransferase [bacterium]